MLKLQALRSLKNQHSQHQQPGERSVRKRAKKYNKRRKTVAFNFDEAIERSAGKTKDSAGSRHLGGILKQSKISRWNLGEIGKSVEMSSDLPARGEFGKQNSPTECAKRKTQLKNILPQV